ncbi:hypothetical protein [Nocardioides sp. CER19]|uniref:MmyB family transcriptional regulator n=1 Tax=Nocardioides sp. CER19 TaxID=3038538 RepID=UPI0024478E5B|nr:hypothetical protein [Nocardioides sp. CER19]MDH2413860.1 hypothetical protein [Nocardioides sp. CER19]
MEDGSGTSPAATSVAQIRVVLDHHLDVVEASVLASALSAAFRVGNNLARSIFLNPESQQSFEDWAAAAALATTMLRRSLGRHGRDPRYDSLVGELAAHSTSFGKYWARPEVDGWERGVLRYFNPITGVQAYEYTLEHQPDGRVNMLWSPADDASRSASHDLWERSGHR